MSAKYQYWQYVLVLVSAIPYYFALVGEYCDRFVCLCVCLSDREHISGTAGPIIMEFFVQIACGRDSVLFWQRYDTLCTSGFMDDVTFGRNGWCVESWTFNLPPLAALQYRGGVWCLWMPYCQSIQLLLLPLTVVLTSIVNITVNEIMANT